MRVSTIPSKSGDEAVHTSILGQALHIANLATAERGKSTPARAHVVSNKDEWYRISNATGAGGQPARLDLYDEIGFWGVTAQDFKDQLGGISAPELTVHINSGGGDVFDGIAILNMLRAHNATVNTVVDGLAASAASFIAMAGQTVTMMPNSTMMIHDASGVCVGNASDMTLMVDLLNKMSDNIASIYASKAGGDVEQWRAAMQTETWYSAQEAVDAGLADQVGDDEDSEPVTTDHWRLSLYNFAGRAAAPPPELRNKAVQCSNCKLYNDSDVAACKGCGKSMASADNADEDAVINWDASTFLDALGRGKPVIAADNGGWDASAFRQALTKGGAA